MSAYRIIEGDLRDRLGDLESGSVQTCVTSPPYWGLRDYGDNGQLGLEPTPERYVENLVDPFCGSGTTGVVALRHDRDFVGIELNPAYAQMARNRIYDDGPLLNVETPGA